MCSWEIFPPFCNLFSSRNCSPPFQKLCHFMILHLLIPEVVSSIIGFFISETTWLHVGTLHLCFPFPGPMFQTLLYDFLCRLRGVDSSFALLHVNTPFSQQHLPRRPSFLQCVIPLSTIAWLLLRLHFWVLCSIPLVYPCLVSPSTALFWLLCLSSIVWDQVLWYLQCPSFCQGFIWLSEGFGIFFF